MNELKLFGLDGNNFGLDGNSVTLFKLMFFSIIAQDYARLVVI